MTEPILRLMRRVDRKLDFVAGLPRGGSMLDVGCGQVPYIRYFRWFRPDIDFCAVDQRDLAGLLEGRVRMFRVCDITSDALPFPDACFDGVYSSHVIEHLGDYGAIRRFVEESYRVTVPGGRLYIETPSERSLKVPSLPFFTWEKSGPMNFRDDPTHNLLVNPGTMSDQLRRQGYRILRAGIYRNLGIAFMILPLPVLAFFIPRRYTAAAIKHVVGWSRYWIAEKP